MSDQKVEDDATGGGYVLEENSPNDFLGPETDFSALSTHVQDIARRLNQEFEIIMESHGPAVVESLLPTIVNVLEKLDELYKDETAYKAEVLQLREDNASLLSELERERCARRESENRLMIMEDQFEDERKILNEALMHNETQIRQLEMKSKNTEEQLARLELKELESSKENSKLHERINELLRSHAELNDSLKNSAVVPVSTPLRQSSNRQLGNAFDTTSAGLGFDELSAMEADFSPPPEDDLPAGMQKEVNILIRENMDLVETKNALNVVKDDLLNQRDVLKSENQLLAEAVQQLSEKQTKLQQELANSDQLLTAARTELEALKASVTKLKAERGDKSSSSKRFTKAEMARLICDRNYYKERFLELQDAIKLTETLRASQRGHPELLKDLPSTVTDVQLHPHQQQQHHGEGVRGAFSRLVNLISLPRLDFGFDAVNLYDLQTDPDQPHLRHTEEAEVASGDKAVVANTAGPAVPFNSQKWIKLYQAGAAAPVFGWVRGFGRVKPESNSLAAAPKNPTLLFSPRAYPVPKKCRSIGGPSLRIELTAAISVPSPVEDSCTQHLWLIGRGSSMLSGSTKTSKNVGKIYIFDPLQLTEVLVGQDLPDDFLPISAAVFSVGGHGSSSPVAKSGRFIVRDFRTLQTDKRSEPVNTFRVLVASSDGRFLVCASTRNPDAVSQSDVCKLVLLATLRLANPGESATSVVCLDYRVCLGVLNSSGLNQLVTLKWLLDSSGTPKNDIELNQFLRVSAMSLPGGAPSGPMILSTIYDRAFFWLGTVGGGAVHCFDLNKSAFVTELALPSQTPCLHAVAVGHRASPDADSRLIWLAVSGLSSQASTQQRTSDSSSETVSIGPLSRLLSICSKKHLFLHNIDLTSVLTSMIDMTDVVDPVDLTVSRLLVQGDECIWFSTRCGLIGRFFNASLPADAAHGSPTEVLNQDAISLSCHAYRRPVSALITIRNRVEAPSADSQDTKATASPSSNQASFLVVAVGHDYTYLRTSTPATRAPPATSAIVSAVNQCVRRSFTGAHAIVWSVYV
uniref:JNK-interacting protein n=1 Tax=Mesocestoides corti TaxID=53468 RepID=A0A5K3FPD8_MESCO